MHATVNKKDESSLIEDIVIEAAQLIIDRKTALAEN